MSDRATVSIAMAVYNGERFIQEQLDSFLHQTRLPDELVISDNASTDSTIEIVRDFAVRAPFTVRVFINDRNLGVTKNFERAISQCSGDLIFLSDCDDVWYPGKIGTIERTFLCGDVAIAQCDAELVDDRLKPLGRSIFQTSGFDPNSATKAMLARGLNFNSWVPIWGNCMAFRSTFKDLVLPLPEKPEHAPSYHDIFIAWTIWFSGRGQIRFLPNRLIAYRQHPTQLAGGPRARSPFSNRLRDLWENRDYTKAHSVKQIVQRVREHGQDSAFAAHPHWQELFEHYWLRATLPRRTWRRVIPVGTELIHKRYHKYSHGFPSAVKDLLFVRSGEL